MKVKINGAIYVPQQKQEGTDEDIMKAIKPYLVKSLEKSDDADKEEE